MFGAKGQILTPMVKLCFSAKKILLCMCLTFRWRCKAATESPPRAEKVKPNLCNILLSRWFSRGEVEVGEFEEVYFFLGFAFCLASRVVQVLQILGRLKIHYGASTASRCANFITSSLVSLLFLLSCLRRDFIYFI